MGYMVHRFEGATVVVTGAASGIGAATAIAFVQEGARVAGIDVDESKLAEVVDACDGRAGTFTPVLGDIRDEVARRGALATAAPEGKLSALVNNAAAFRIAGADATDEQWDETLGVNLLAPARLVAEATPLLIASGEGAVVNLASISGHIAQRDRWTYNAVKGATLNLTRCQAIDLADKNVRVNSVSPGWIWTEILDKAANGNRAHFEPMWAKYHAMGRIGRPEEVAAAILFLCSADASFITGADLPVDGGYLAMGPERGDTVELP